MYHEKYFPIPIEYLPNFYSLRSLQVTVVTGNLYVLLDFLYLPSLCNRSYLFPVSQLIRVHVHLTFIKCLTMKWHLTICMLNLGTFCLALHSSFHLCFEEKFHIFFALILVARMAKCHSWKGCVLEWAQAEPLAQEKETIPVSRRFIYSLFKKLLLLPSLTICCVRPMFWVPF